MNKYKEALDEIKSIVLDTSGDGYHTPKYLQNFYFNSCETLQELVDRATPKQVEYFNDEYCCDACGCKLFADRPVDFCPNCGQALDWRDENDC